MIFAVNFSFRQILSLPLLRIIIFLCQCWAIASCKVSFNRHLPLSTIHPLTKHDNFMLKLFKIIIAHLTFPIPKEFESKQQLANLFSWVTLTEKSFHLQRRSRGIPRRHGPNILSVWLTSIVDILPVTDCTWRTSLTWLWDHSNTNQRTNLVSISKWGTIIYTKRKI